MIDSISLQNFQTHRRLHIDLDPHITIVVGPSDVGKSSIIRALNYVAFNSPSGDAFIRDGSKGCTVTIRTNGHVVKRRRGKQVNHYEIDGRKLEALRKGEVPDDVLNALQLDELNIQHQHDAPLWLSESAGQVAKNLNEIVNLDLIDRVLTRLSRATRQVSSELTVCENRLLAAKSTAKELEWVEQAIADYEAVERAEAKIQEAQQEHTQLLTIVQSLEKQEEKITRLEGIVEPAQKDLDDLQETNKQWNELQDSAESLRNLLLQIGRLEGQMYEADRQGSLVDKQLKSVKTCPLCQRPIGKQ